MTRRPHQEPRNLAGFFRSNLRRPLLTKRPAAALSAPREALSVTCPTTVHATLVHKYNIAVLTFDRNVQTLACHPLSHAR